MRLFERIVMMTRTPESVEKFHKVIAADRRLTLRMLADKVNVGRNMIRVIITKYLSKRKVCATMYEIVKTSLTTECR